MGAGKSTLGPLLAERLGRPFVSVDAVVEQEWGRDGGGLLIRGSEVRILPGAWNRLQISPLRQLIREPRD
jgi:hypothetical protein